MTKLTDIESIGPVYSAKLNDAGVSSIEKLLEMGGTRKGRAEIAKSTGLTEKKILSWVNRADLSRIKGIGTQYADLLEHAGVDTVPELSQRNSENLFNKMKELNEEKKLVRVVPALSAVEDWITQAKSLPRAVEY